MKKKWKYLMTGLCVGCVWTLLFIACSSMTAPSHEPLLFGQGCIIFAVPNLITLWVLLPLIEQYPRLYAVSLLGSPIVLFGLAGLIIGALKDAKAGDSGTDASEAQ